MIYALLLPIVRMAVQFYFRRIDVIGLKNIPKKGPVVLIANHPSALLDPLVVAIIAKRQLHFIAAAEYFGNKFTSWLFQRQFNMIPVYRPDRYKKEEFSNTDMFQHCFQRLQDGHVIIIFPEGTSETEKRVRKLKTGTVRMVLGAQVHSNVRIPIIPIGLNYTNPHRFQSDVIVRIGEQIYLPEPLTVQDTHGVQAATEYLEEKLIECVFHIADEKMEKYIHRIEQVFNDQLFEDLNISDSEVHRKFIASKDVINSVEFFEEEAPEKVMEVNKELDLYFDEVGKLPMHGRLMKYANKRISLFDAILIVLISPFFIAGYILNAVPFYTSGYYFKHRFLPKFNKYDESGEPLLHPVFGGSLAFALGSSFFIVWYLILFILCGVSIGWIWGLYLILSAYLLGQLSLYYVGLYRKVKDILTFRRIRNRHRDQMKIVLEQHQKLIKLLQRYASLYLEQR